MKRVEPVNDPAELASVQRAVDAMPISRLAMSKYIRADGRIVGGSVREGAEPDEGDRLGVSRANKLAAAFGQARLKVPVICQTCDRTNIALWRHVTGVGRLTADEWTQARLVRGEDCGPWRGWLVDEVSRRAWRDYWEGYAIVRCACGRSIDFTIQAMLDRLDPCCSDCGRVHLKGRKRTTLPVTA